MEPNAERQIASIDNKVTSILQILQGNSLDPKDHGMIGEVRETKERVTKLENAKRFVIGWATGFGVAAGVLITLILKK